MTLFFPQEKVKKIKTQCVRVYRAQEITLLELTRLLGTLTSTIQAILPARLQFLYLQQQQIAALKRSISYMATNSDIERYGQRETCMVDKKFRIKQWSGHYSASLTNANADRYFQERLGCNVSRCKNWGPEDQEGTGESYKSFRTFSNKIFWPSAKWWISNQYISRYTTKLSWVAS